MRLPTLHQFRDGVRRYANPAYHLRKLREDLQSVWQALRTHREVAEGTLTEEELATSFRGNLLACFYLSGPFIWIGLSLSYWLQRKLENPFVGQYSTHAINMVVTTLAYQMFWWMGNNGVYRREEKGGKARFRAFERDLLPVHWAGIRIGFTFNLITWPITSLIMYLIQAANRNAAIAIPAPLIQHFIDAAFVNTTFMRLMGDFFEHWSKELARRHMARKQVTGAA